MCIQNGIDVDNEPFHNFTGEAETRDYQVDANQEGVRARQHLVIRYFQN